MITNSRTQILDCTIRDGGYINDWNFDPKMVRELYRNVSKSGVKFIEIGFRNMPDKTNVGPWYSVTEELLATVTDGIQGSEIALMADVGKLDVDSVPSADESHVALYRIATHKDQLSLAFKLCDEIKKKGYLTSLQLMGIISYSNEELLQAIKIIKASEIDYIYFADSYGSMTPAEITYYCETLRTSGKKVGFHAHNNMQLAFANTLEAIRNKADIVDATVFGMGRGAGNVPLEVLLAYLQKVTDSTHYNAMPVLDIADRYFTALMKEYHWGYQLPYMLSGIFKVHPTYARELVERHEYGMEDMVKALEEIREEAPVGFKKAVLDHVIEKKLVQETTSNEGLKEPFENVEKNIQYVDRHEGKDFLILATGPSLKNAQKDLQKFISQHDPVVIGTNYLEGLFTPAYHMFSNKRRFVNYVDHVSPESKILLSSSFEDDFIEEYTNRAFEVIYHVFNKDGFGIEDGVLEGDFRTVALLGIATAIAMGAKRIFIAGMDGYKIQHQDKDDSGLHFYEEHEEAEQEGVLQEKHLFNENMLAKMSAYFQKKGKGDFCIITPTSHEKFYSNIKEWIK